MGSKKQHISGNNSRRRLGRIYPPRPERERILSGIEAMPAALRSPQAWYTLGSLLIYEATLDEDDAKLNRGTDALLQAADADNPEPEAFLELTWVLLYRGLDALAIKYATKATEALPGYRDTWSLRAWAHIGQGQRAEAISSLERAVAVSDSLPSDADLLEGLRKGGDLHEIRKEFVLGHATVELLAENPGTEEEVVRNSVFALRQILKLQPEDVKTLYALAAGYYGLKDYVRAEHYLTRLFAVSSAHVDGLVLKALVRSKIGTEDEPLEWYDKALQLDPKHLLANTNRAAPLLRDRRFREAQRYVEAALEGNGDAEHRARARDQMGTILCEEYGDYKKALRYHAEAVELAPGTAEFQVNHLVSLIQANDMYGLQKYWNRYRSFLSRQTEPQAQSVCKFAPAYLTRISDPWQCIGAAEALAPIFSWHGVTHFLREAWSLVDKVPNGDKPGFCARAGIMAGKAGHDELALQFFTKGETYDEIGGTLSLDCAVALADLGHLDEAIAKAHSCRSDQPGALTVLANVLQRADRHDEALDTYLRAIETDTDFLPIRNGLYSAILAWRPSAIRRFIELAQERWPGDTSARLLVGNGLAALGLYGDAANEFAAAFVTQNRFQIPECPPPSRVDTEIAERVPDTTEEASVRPDRILKEAFEASHYLLDFGYALLHSGQLPTLGELIEWVQGQPDICNGDWSVLQAERFRLLGEHELVLSELKPLGEHMSAVATRVLSYLDAGNAGLAGETAAGELAKEATHSSFNHAQGDSTAICMAVVGLAAIVEGQFDTALGSADRAIGRDARCPIGWLAKAKALWATGREDEAVAAGADGLHHCPGDPDLYEWYQETCLQSGRLESSAAMQAEMRDALLSRNKETLFHALQARIAEARFDEPTNHIRMLIRAGEGTGLEFKSTLRWNVRAGKQDEEMTYACLKTIAAFLNTNGGTLLIGVADDGKIVGIGQDGFASNDRFLQHLSNKLLSALGEVAASYIESRIYALDNFEVCVVECKPSKVPVYLRSKSEEEFYVRTGPRSDRLPHSKFLEYARTRFTV